jgi:hypothetical protein
MASAWERELNTRAAPPVGADASLDHLLLGDLVALLVTTAVAYQHIAAMLRQRLQHTIGFSHRQRDRLLHQHRLAALDRREHRGQMFAFAGGDDHGGNVGVIDHREIVAAMAARADQRREFGRVRRIEIGHADAADRRVPGCEPGAQSADSSRADDS